jgi:hypothetical protein
MNTLPIKTSRIHWTYQGTAYCFSKPNQLKLKQKKR